VANLTIRIKGEDGYERVELTDERMVLGRSSDSDIPVKSEKVSRSHCAFVRDGEDWYVEDLGGANGTYVGRDKVAERTRLEERSIIKVGNVRITFHYQDPLKAKRAIEIADAADDAAEPGPVISRERGINDPLDAIPCERCAIWFNIGHRLPGDTMACPRCGHKHTVPQLVNA
jgi:predicted component of type VI protein secretion system